MRTQPTGPLWVGTLPGSAAVHAEVVDTEERRGAICRKFTRDDVLRYQDQPIEDFGLELKRLLRAQGVHPGQLCRDCFPAEFRSDYMLNATRAEKDADDAADVPHWATPHPYLTPAQRLLSNEER